MSQTKSVLAIMMGTVLAACGQPIDESSTESALSSHGHRLKDGAGNDKGWVDVDALDDGYVGLSVHIVAVLKHGVPGATYTLARAPEPPSSVVPTSPWASPNGICERGDAGGFLAFPGGTLTTDEDGNGSVELAPFRAPSTSPFQDGTSFDVSFRLANADASSDLRSDCVVVDVL